MHYAQLCPQASRKPDASSTMVPSVSLSPLSPPVLVIWSQERKQKQPDLPESNCLRKKDAKAML